jgi:TatD DNase family protein
MANCNISPRIILIGNYFRYLKKQLEVASKFPQLPLFLHCRDAASDLTAVLSEYNLKGVVHSFDGTFEEAEEFLKLGYYIGLNGW